MFAKMTFLSLGILLLACAFNVSAQRPNAKQNQPFGWDLTYNAILKSNNIGRNGFLRKWLKQNDSSYVANIIASRKGEAIISSILLENPAFHAGEHQVTWLFRTANRAYFWESVEGKSYSIKREFEPKLYDQAVQTISSWQQSKPLTPTETPPQGTSEYIAILSFYKNGESKQMLLTMADFYIYDKTAEDDYRIGRMVKVLEPITEKQL